MTGERALWTVVTQSKLRSQGTTQRTRTPVPSTTGNYFFCVHTGGSHYCQDAIALFSACFQKGTEISERVWRTLLKELRNFIQVLILTVFLRKKSRKFVKHVDIYTLEIQQKCKRKGYFQLCKTKYQNLTFRQFNCGMGQYWFLGRTRCWRGEWLSLPHLKTFRRLSLTPFLCKKSPDKQSKLVWPGQLLAE